MLKPANHSATCLCGSVKVHVVTIDPNFTVCHCNECRQWGGVPLFMLKCGADVVFEGEECIKEYDSSDWGTRGFCTNCGTHLFSRFKEPASYNIPVGLFPDVEGLEMSMQYFSDYRPSYYCFSTVSDEMTEAEIYEAFSVDEKMS